MRSRKPPGASANTPAQKSAANFGLAGLVEILRRVAEQSARAAAVQADVTHGLSILAEKLTPAKPAVPPATGKVRP
jgi:hypothetical protein